MNYYNEFNPEAAAWLRELIAAKLIPAGYVDERNIKDVDPDDLLGYDQCHFFAGIGGWSQALQIAGWRDKRNVWSGSCPCQPYSSAGKQLGTKDERDLWPEFFRLIAKCQPEFVFGEQVENAIRHGWLDRVYTDLEGANYAVGAVVLGAHSVGAPHRRYRLYWGGALLADNTRRKSKRNLCVGNGIFEENSKRPPTVSPGYIYVGELADGHAKLQEWSGNVRTAGRGEPSNGCDHGELAENAAGGGCGRRDDGNPSRNEGEIQTPGLGVDQRIPHAESAGLEQTRESCVESTKRLAVRSAGDGVSYAEGDGRDKRRTESGERGIGSGRGCGGVGNSSSDDEWRNTLSGCDGERIEDRGSISNCGVEDVQGFGRDICNTPDIRTSSGEVHAFADADQTSGGVADGYGAGLEGRNTGECPGQCASGPDGMADFSPWSDFRYIYCRDDKVRRISAESLVFGVADGLSEGMDYGGTGSVSEDGGFPLTTKKEGRAMLLSGYGNAIVPQVAGEFVRAFGESVKEMENA